MNNNCCSPQRITSWIDLPHVMPENPLDLIAYAKINNTEGVYQDSDDFISPPAGWTDNTVEFGSTVTCKALRDDDGQKVADAVFYSFSHEFLSGDTDIAPALKKVIFMRSGNQWQMNIDLAFGATTFTDIELSYRNNAATRGDKQGTIPVISFTGENFTGTQTFYLTLNRPGQVMMAFRLIDDSNNWYFFEMEWNIIAE